MMKIHNSRSMSVLGIVALGEVLWEIARSRTIPVKPVVTAVGFLSRISGVADAVIGGTKTIVWTTLLTTATIGSLEIYRRYWKQGEENRPVTININVNGEKVKAAAVEA